MKDQPILYGEYKNYYENGQLKEIYNYNNGLLNGEYKSYHENGQLKEIYNYKNEWKI